MFVDSKISRIFASLLRNKAFNDDSGCSAVRLAHLLWEQGVPGSNPGIPTKKIKELQQCSSFFLYLLFFLVEIAVEVICLLVYV